MKSAHTHILVIRLSAMGDVAMTVPVLSAFLAQNSSIKITVLTRPFFAPLFKELDRTSVFSPDLKGVHKGFLGLVQLHKELVQLHIDVVVDLHNVLRSTILVHLFKLRGIPCYQLDKGKKEKKQLTVAKKDKLLFPLKSMHERYAEALRKTGFSVDMGKNYTLSSRAIPSYVANKLNGKKLVGIAPFATYASKSLPIFKLNELVHQLRVYKTVSVLLFCGGSKEKEVLERISKEYTAVYSVVQKGSFEEELHLISNLDVMIAMDSGNGHIAAMYNIPVITIWGVTHPFLGFTPFKQPMKNQILPDLTRFPLIPTSVYGKKYPKHYLNCFDTIKVNQIVSKVEEYIAE